MQLHHYKEAQPCTSFHNKGQLSVVVKISGKMFLIGDSQLTGVTPRSGEFISCHRGARIQDIVDIIDDIVINL